MSFDEPSWEPGKNFGWRFRRADGAPWGQAELWSTWTSAWGSLMADTERLEAKGPRGEACINSQTWAARAMPHSGDAAMRRCGDAAMRRMSAGNRRSA